MYVLIQKFNSIKRTTHKKMSDGKKSIPSRMRQITLKQFGGDYRTCTEIEEVDTPLPAADEVLIKCRYWGINASDILFSEGLLLPGVSPPYTAGLEALAEIVATGKDCKLQVGQFVIAFDVGCFREYHVMKENACIVVPSLNPCLLTLIISGCTASLALKTKAELKAGETVLVTGAAGGTGQFAVQLAKLAGCHVIGTCSTQEKATFLKELGCDRTINYNTESLDDVLQKQYPNGINVVYECIGNKIFDTALKHLADHGRLLVIGAISCYESQGLLMEKATNSSPIPMTILFKNADLRGFHLPHFIGEPIVQETKHLVDLYIKGQLKANVDYGMEAPKGPFIGLEKIYDAIDHMYSRKNTGKVVVAADSSVLKEA